MEEKGFLANILSQLSLKIEKIDFEVDNVSINLLEKTGLIEKGDFTMSNIYKGETLITPKINFNVSDFKLPLEDILPLLEEKLKNK